MTAERENEIPRISWRGWVVILVISLAVGVSLHWAITASVYYAASAASAKAMAGFARNWGGTKDGRDNTGKSRDGQLPAAEFMLRYMGLAKDSVDPNLFKRLNSAYPEHTPALVVAARLLGPGQSSECNEDIVRNVASALGRQLLGWPGDTKSELLLLKRFRQARVDGASGALAPEANKVASSAQVAAKSEHNVRNSIEEACKAFQDASAPAVKLLGPTFSRTGHKSGDDLAEIILGADACLPGGSSNSDFTECRLIKTLFGGTLNADSVRSSRLRINFLWGWERAAVLVLALLVLLAIWRLRRKRKPLERQENWLREWLAEADRRLSPNKPGTPNTDPRGEAKKMHQQFHETFGLSESRGPPYDWKGGLTVLRDLIDATQESLQTEHRSHLEKFVELHTQALARQRAFINALITAFPAIGLVATLDGLIIALSRASGIVAGTEAERFASTELVTGVLSSSFATTMLALIAMAVCMLINVREEHREADLLESTHKRLLAVFWPGRPASATTV